MRQFGPYPARAETVERSEDGTRNRIPISFSTIPTAAASFNPRWLANMVITRKASAFSEQLGLK